MFVKGPNGMTVAEPTMAAWDKVYKALQGRVERNQFTGRLLSDKVSRKTPINRLPRAALCAAMSWAALAPGGTWPCVRRASMCPLSKPTVAATIKVLASKRYRGQRAGDYRAPVTR